MDPSEEDRLVAAFRTASRSILPLNDHIELCRTVACVLGWKRVTEDRWKTLKLGFRIALLRKIWLRQAEGARGPYPYADPRPISRYSAEQLDALTREALKRSGGSGSANEDTLTVLRFLGFTTPLDSDLVVLTAVIEKVRGHR